MSNINHFNDNTNNKERENINNVTTIYATNDNVNNDNSVKPMIMSIIRMCVML